MSNLLDIVEGIGVGQFIISLSSLPAAGAYAVFGAGYANVKQMALMNNEDLVKLMADATGEYDLEALREQGIIQPAATSNILPSPSENPMIRLSDNAFSMGSNMSASNRAETSYLASGVNQIQQKINAVLAQLWQQEQSRWLERADNLSSSLRDSMNQETMTTKDYNNAHLQNKIQEIEKEAELLAARGIDISGIKENIEKFKEIMQQKFEKMAEQAVRDFQNDTALLEAQASKNPLAISAAQRTIALAKIADEKEQKVKKGESKEDIDRWAAAKTKIVDNDHDKAQRTQDATNPATAGIEAMRQLQERTTDYAAIMVQAFDQISGSMQNHFSRMMTGAESFSAGFKAIFQDMTNAIITMFVKMWFNQYVLKPLEKWFKGILNIPETPKTDPTEKKATGGTVAGGSQYLVGEVGPELFVPYSSGTIVPNHQLGDAMSSNGAAPTVNINVVNNTNTQANARQQQTRWDGRQYVIDIVLDAYARNVNGMRDVMGARG